MALTACSIAILAACTSPSAQPAASPSNDGSAAVCQAAQELVDYHIARGSVPHAVRDKPTATDDAKYAQLTSIITGAATKLETAAVQATNPDLRDAARTVANEDLQSDRAPIQQNWTAALDEVPKVCAASGHAVENFDILNMAG
jgi:hypothetical protein